MPSKFETLEAFVRQNGGWIISPADSWPATLEVREDSPLPGRLSALGLYRVEQQPGIGERIVPDGRVEYAGHGSRLSAVKREGMIQTRKYRIDNR